MTKIFLLIITIFSIISCAGQIANRAVPETYVTDVDVLPTDTHPADAAIPLGKIAVVAASNWLDPVGSIAAIDIFQDYKVQSALVTTDGSDTVLRSFGGYVYAINRYGTDTIQVINPATFRVIANYSVGHGSNPQDIWVASDKKAYLTRMDAQNDPAGAGDVLIINPLTGTHLDSIDLKSYTNDDGDRLARAAQMVAVGNNLFVCLQDLPRNLLEPANTNGKVAVIDMITDEVLTVIELSGRNPADITYSPLTDLIYVSDSGVFNNFETDTSDSYGGIEIIEPKTFENFGMLIDDAALGGYPSEIRIASALLGFVVTSGTKIAKFNPSSFEVTGENFYIGEGSFIPDISINYKGEVVLTERSSSDSGIVFISPMNGEIAVGPLPVGASPASITFVDGNIPEMEPDETPPELQESPPKPTSGLSPKPSITKPDSCWGFAESVASFLEGDGSGFGVDKFPSVVLGAPVGGGAVRGGVDVLSLGKNGEIVLDLENCLVVDGPGADFIVFENPFLIGGRAGNPYKELGAVAVSNDGVNFVEFLCHMDAYPYTGCAGWNPVYSSPSNAISPFDMSDAGGDPFDLADIGVEGARYVRIRDLDGGGSGGAAGFDLDAVAIVNGELY